MAEYNKNFRSYAVNGTQWGDEGKGKIIDIIAGKADIVARSQGGNNAGHTVVSGDKTYKLHLVPSGILYDKTRCYIGAGVVIDPKDFLGELTTLSGQGVKLTLADGSPKLMVDYRAHVVFPWHITLDGLSETYRGKSDIGTTKRGIGPCYADKAERLGIRICDLIDPAILKRKLYETGKLKNDIITKIYGGTALDLDAIYAEYAAYGDKLRPLAADVSVLIDDAAKAGKTIMFEGAQATLLDIDFGTYPYVTSSHPVIGGVLSGIGVGAKVISEVIGVAKAYTTRVGKGPFPTELDNEIGEHIRVAGGEFGTTTGRPRRTGWFDALIVKYSVRVNGITQLAVNKLDTLSGIGDLKICTGYRDRNGNVLSHFPPSIEMLEGCEPIYETLAGFDEDISACRTADELPPAALAYILRLETLCECRVSMIGVGPDREQTIDKPAA